MIIRLLRALVAQLDRALGYEPGGRGFDSLPARHLFSRIDGGRFLCFASRNVLRRGGRVAEGAPLLREYLVYPGSRVRIPPSPPLLTLRN